MDASYWKSRKVLVTGADGFIGSHLTERLVSLGADVRAFCLYNSNGSYGWLDGATPETRDAVEFMLGDIRDARLMEQACEGVDTVFHLAALIAIPYSYVAPLSYVSVNIAGTTNVLQACRMHGVARVVVTSTSEVYGTALYVPIDEAHPLQGQSPYSASKIGADKIAESYFLSFGTPVVTLRPFNTYGPRQSDRAVIPTIAAQLASGCEELTLGSVTPVRDFLFVKDTARAFLHAACEPGIEGQTVHVGTGVGVTIGETAKRLMAIAGRQVPIRCSEQRKRPPGSEVMQLLCDPSRGLELMGFAAQWELDAGLAEVYASVQARLHAYRPAEYQR